MQISVSEIVNEFSQWNLFLMHDGPDTQITLECPIYKIQVKVI